MGEWARLGDALDGRATPAADAETLRATLQEARSALVGAERALADSGRWESLRGHLAEIIGRVQRGAAGQPPRCLLQRLSMKAEAGKKPRTWTVNVERLSGKQNYRTVMRAGVQSFELASAYGDKGRSSTVASSS